MKTNGGYIITKFKKLDKVIKNGILEPHIYSGIVDIPNYEGEIKKQQKVTWDKFGRVLNSNRWHDCNIDVSSI